MFRTLFTAALIFVAISSWSQTFKVAGTIQLVSYHQGGVELMPDAYEPKPTPNYTMYVVRYNGALKKPTLIDSVQSDSLGQFIIHLPEGEYGFVLSNNESDFDIGQYLPPELGDGSEKDPNLRGSGNGITRSDNWTINNHQPLKVGPEKMNHVILTHYMVSICNLCP